jgi:NADPH:quinone reductase-like Zn-dependent oxidoreductase
MRAYEIGEAFGIDHLSIADHEIPKPGYGQALIKVRAVSLNYRDLMVVKGLYNPRIPLPFTPFSDGAGDVVAIGEGVSRVTVGDRVAGIFMQDWLAGEMTEAKQRSALGGGGQGMLAEYVVLREEGLVQFPEHLSYEEAATLPCAAVTAWHAVIETGIKPGDRVLLLGTGGVSLFALQFARLAGGEVFITSGSSAKIEKARQLGAARGINYKTNPDWGKKVRGMTGGQGVDLVVEVGGAGTLPESLDAVRTGGRISLIGVLSGTTGEINPLPIVMKKVRLQGIFVGSREMFEAMNSAIALQKIRPVIDRVFSFDGVADALSHMERGGHFGKICVSVT